MQRADAGLRTVLVRLTAGGRVDLRGDRAGSRRAGWGERPDHRAGRRRALPQPTEQLDLLTYGTPGRWASTRRRPTGASPTPSGDGPASSTAGPASGGRSTATCSPTYRCSSSRRATSCSMHIENHSGRRIPCICTATTPSSSPQRGEGDRQPVVGRLAQRGERRRLRHRVRRRQPGHLDGPLPQPRPRRPGPGRAPGLRRRHRALPRRQASAAATTSPSRSGSATGRTRPATRAVVARVDRPTGRGADRGSGTIGVPDVASTRTAS